MKDIQVCIIYTLLIFVAMPSDLHGQDIDVPGPHEEVMSRDQDDLALRVQIAISDNIAKIRSWSGKAIVNDDCKLSKSKSIERRAKIDFALDRSRDAFSYKWCVEASASTKNLVRTRDDFLTGATKGGMKVGDDLYESDWFNPKLKSKEGLRTQGQSVTLRPTTPIPIGDMTEFFDPLFFFTLGGETFESVINNFRFHKSTKGIDYIITTEDQIITMTKIDAIKHRERRLVFDLRYACNLVSATARDKFREEKWERTYVCIDGIFVPNVIRYENQGSGDNAVHSKRVVTWEHHSLNNPLPDGAFSLEAVGAIPGAAIHDERSAQTTYYKSSDPTVRRPKTKAKSWSTLQITLLAAFGVIVVAMIAIIILRNKRTGGR